MTRDLPPAENERHPAVDTFERVLNNGVIVDRSSGEGEATPGHPVGLPRADWVTATHPFFQNELSKASDRD